jgi:hypothetical protein
MHSHYQRFKHALYHNESMIFIGLKRPSAIDLYCTTPLSSLIHRQTLITPLTWVLDRPCSLVKLELTTVQRFFFFFFFKKLNLLFHFGPYLVQLIGPSYFGSEPSSSTRPRTSFSSILLDWTSACWMHRGGIFFRFNFK